MRKIRPILLTACCTAMLWVTSSASAQKVQDNVQGDMPAAVTELAGNWEISNADREKSCNLVLKREGSKDGGRIELGKDCGNAFPALKGLSNWRLVKGDLRFINSQGRLVINFTEVESGMYEAEHKDGLYFLQSQNEIAPASIRKTEDMFGDWVLARAGKTICMVTLTNASAGETSFALRVQPGCDQAALSLQPSHWLMDRGELVLSANDGQSLRFEEYEPGQWRRVPDGAGGLTIARK